MTDLGHAWKFKDDRGKLKKARANEQGDAFAGNKRQAFSITDFS